MKPIVNPEPRKLVHKYFDAKDFVIQEGYGWEIDWQSERSFERLTEQEFLKETAWVILSSGFRESIVSRLFPQISESYLNWEDSILISESIDDCHHKALEVFHNTKKIDAISSSILRVATEGFQNIKRKIQKFGIAYLQGFPFIGPVTGIHLLKNIGLQVAKPDRHLNKIAKTTGFESAQELCEWIKDKVGDEIAEIDVILWRFATLKPDYVAHFCI